MSGASARVDLRTTPLSLDEVVAHVRRPGAGGIATFLGVVRDESEGRAVTRLDYSAYDAMAKREMRKIADELEAEMEGVRVSAIHRVGELGVGDAAIACAASAPHRGEAFRACRALIDRIKERVPIWKREWGPDGVAWVGWVDARCSPEGTHGHAHGHALEEDDPR
jgi:molybdopterin synthase catalytic subunit